MRTGRVLAICAAALGFAGASRAELRMVMVEQDGCVWCAKWNAEIAPIWPRTAEGEAAPLRRIDLHAPVPSDLDFASPPRITPTFVLTENGTEVGRVEGYPGEDLFWMMMTRLFEGVEPDGRSNTE